MSDKKPVAATLNLFQRICKVYEEVKSVAKTATIELPNNKDYKAVTHDMVTAILHGPLQRNGIIVLTDVKQTKVERLVGVNNYGGEKITYWVTVDVSVRFQNIDDKDDFIVSNCTSYALDSGDKAIGKAISMAVKIILLKTFMLESLDEEEKRNEPGTNYTEAAEFTFPDGKYARQKLTEISDIDLKSYHDTLVAVKKTSKYYNQSQQYADAIASYLMNRGQNAK